MNLRRRTTPLSILLAYTFIIFGWGNTKTKDSGETYPTRCSNCQNDVYYHLIKISKRLTLFFIPVFPYSRDYLLTCPVCGASIELDRNDRSEAKELNDATEKFLDEQISSKEFEEELIGFENNVSAIETVDSGEKETN